MVNKIAGLICVIVLTAATCGVCAEAPKFDATGTWSVDVSDGWTTCPGEDPPGPADSVPSVPIVQTGATFTADWLGEIAAGAVSGARYTVLVNHVGDGLADSLNVTWDLISGNTTTGHNQSSGKIPVHAFV